VLSAEAYSFRLKSRLAISLSWIAGYTNVFTLIACNMFVSHQTGNTTHLGQAIGNLVVGRGAAAERALVETGYFGFIVGMFLLGAISSALMTEGARRAGRASKYIAPMSVEAVLLIMLMTALRLNPYPTGSALWVTTGIAAFAMGLQNATITKISGAIVRTTHLTGVITDLGLEGVQLLLWWRDKVKSAKAGRYGRVLKVSRRHPTVLRVALLASIFGSFLIGATLGTITFIKIGPLALLAPVLFLIWIVGVDYFTPIADVREIDPTQDKELKALFGNIKSLLPPDVGVFRLAHHNASRLHQAPDFAGWVDRVPRQWRVVILVISPLTQFDHDTAASLLMAVQRLKNEGRTLVISGMNRVQFKTLAECGLTKVIDLDNFVPDLEFAIARGMNLALVPPPGSR
jgi:uncharacterized membrane protein YoaK (UPF0700 family)/anti-anti-sigma regulatory factor